MEFILKKKPKECIFCLSGNDRNYLLLKKKYAFLILNLYPYNNGHLLAAPCRHVGEIEELSRSEIQALWGMVKEGIRGLKKVLKPDGFNLGINLGKVAGAGVLDHLHIHIVPRWRGDTNFMPIIGETKVIPEAIEATYQKLKVEFKKCSG
jgi:ATP adenylyltransferase